MNTSKTRAKTASVLNTGSYGGGVVGGEFTTASTSTSQNRIFNGIGSSNQSQFPVQNHNQNQIQNSPKPPTFLPLCQPRNEHAVKLISFPSTIPVNTEYQPSQWLSSPIPVPKMSHSARRFAKSTPILINISSQSNPNSSHKLTSLLNSPVLPRRHGLRSNFRHKKTTHDPENGTNFPDNGNVVPSITSISNLNTITTSSLKSSLKKSSPSKSNKNEGNKKSDKVLKVKDVKKPSNDREPPKLRDRGSGSSGELTACLVPVKGGASVGGASGGTGTGTGTGVGASKANSNSSGSFMGDKMQVIRTEQEKLRNPETIRLDKCGLKHFPLITPASEPTLKLLSLQHNQITRLENVPALSHLVVLDIYDNRIEKITGLQGLNSLRVLLLGKNRIRRIEGLEGLRRLEILDLHGNQLRYVDNLGCLASLRVLNLAGNNFKTIRLGPSNLLALTELNLKRNRIRNLEGLQKAPHLKKLLLANNELSSAACLWPLRKLVFLQEILFEPNQLCFSPDYFSQILTIFPSLEILDRSTITDSQRSEARAWHRKRLAEDEEKKKIEQVKLTKIQNTPATREEIILQARRRWQSVKNFVKHSSNSIETPTATSTAITSAERTEKYVNSMSNGSNLNTTSDRTAVSSISRMLFQNCQPVPADLVHKEPLVDFDITSNSSSNLSVANSTQNIANSDFGSTINNNNVNSNVSAPQQQFFRTANEHNNHNFNDEIETTLSATVDLENQLESQTALSDQNDDEAHITDHNRQSNVDHSSKTELVLPKPSSKIAVVRPLVRNRHVSLEEEDNSGQGPGTVPPDTLLENGNKNDEIHSEYNSESEFKIGKTNNLNQNQHQNEIPTPAVFRSNSQSQITHLKDLLEAQIEEDDAVTDDNIVEENDELFPVVPESDSISCLIENHKETAEDDVRLGLELKRNAILSDKVHFKNRSPNRSTEGPTDWSTSNNLEAINLIKNQIRTILSQDHDQDDQQSTTLNGSTIIGQILIPIYTVDDEINKNEATTKTASGKSLKRSASSVSLPTLSAGDLNEATRPTIENVQIGNNSTNSAGIGNNFEIKDTLQVPGNTPNKNKLALMKNLRSQSFDVGSRYSTGGRGFDLVSSDSESSDGTSSFMTTNTSELGNGRVNRKFFPRNRAKIKKERLQSSKNQGAFPSGRRPYTGVKDSSQNRGPNPNRPLKRCDSAISDLSPGLTPATMKKQGTDYLVEIDGRTLNIYGQGALKYTMMGFPVSLTSHVTTAKFHYISYDTLIPYFGKIRQIYPSLEHFQFRANNLTTLSQLNSLADLQGLTSLHIVKEGNPLIANELWPNYAAYRLSHWGLQNINGKQITPPQPNNRVADLSLLSSISPKSFESLGYVALSCLPQTALTPLAKRLHTLHCFCCCSPSSSSDDSGRRGKGGAGNNEISATGAAGAAGLSSPAEEHACTSWDDDPVLLDVIGKEALVHAPPPLLPDSSQAKLKERTDISGKIIHGGVEILEKLDLLEKVWPSLLSEVVQDILMDFLLMDNYMKKELKKLTDIALLTKNKLP